MLVIDDAPEFLELIAGMLRKEGYDVSGAPDGNTGVDLAREIDPDLVVLDLTLPDIDGMEVCRQLREFTDAYIIMCSARNEEIDRVMGLKTGADDYVTKPFSPREVAARVEAMLRRPRSSSVQPTGGNGQDSRTFDDLVIHPLAREVEISGAAVELTRIEFDILDVLSERPRMVHSRAVLRERVWGEDWFGDDHVVDVHIANLRKKIDVGDGPSHVRTVRGVGYRMEG